MLFRSKSFDVPVKNYPLAKAAVEKIENAELVELKGYSREEVALLMNGCDVALMTSFTEGSPQFVKDAIACGTPVVSTAVVDVKSVIEGIDNCLICSYEVYDVVEKIAQIIGKNNESSHDISNYSNAKIAIDIIDLYKQRIRK